MECISQAALLLSNVNIAKSFVLLPSHRSPEETLNFRHSPYFVDGAGDAKSHLLMATVFGTRVRSVGLGFEQVLFEHEAARKEILSANKLGRWRAQCKYCRTSMCNMARKRKRRLEGREATIKMDEDNRFLEDRLINFTDASNV